MHSISPVFNEENVHLERVIALDQPEYAPLIGLPVIYPDETRGVAVRFELSDNERQMIAEGGDILITELTFGGKFTPISIEISKKDQSHHG